MMMEVYRLVPVIQLVKVDNAQETSSTKPRPLIPKLSSFDLPPFDMPTKTLVKRKEITLPKKRAQNDVVRNDAEGKTVRRETGGDLVKTEQQNDYRRCSKCKILKPASRYYKGQTQCKRCLLIYKQWKRYDSKRTKEENEDVQQLRKDFFAKRWIELGITG